MNEDETLFRISMWGLAILFVVIGLFQVSVRAQTRQLNTVRQQTFYVEQDLAKKNVSLSTRTRPENLHHLIPRCYPDADIIGFNRIVNLYDISERK